MRQETAKIARAFAAGEPARGNRSASTGDSVVLHGSRIVWRDAATPGAVWLSLAGWNTATTRDRINGALTYAAPGWRIRTIGGAAHVMSPTGALHEMGPHDVAMIDPATETVAFRA